MEGIGVIGLRDLRLVGFALGVLCELLESS